VDSAWGDLEKLHRVLLPGERVLWQGRPRSRWIRQSEVQALALGVLGLALGAVLLVAFRNGGPGTYLYGAIAGFAFGLGVPTAVIVVDHRRRDRSICAVTDRRAVVLRWSHHPEATTAPLASSFVYVEQPRRGSVTVRFGDPVAANRAAGRTTSTGAFRPWLRWEDGQAGLGRAESGPTVPHLAFYDVPGPDVLLGVVERARVELWRTSGPPGPWELTTISL